MPGYVCSTHFSNEEHRALSYEEQNEAENVCLDCISVREAERARAQQKDTIDPDQPIGVHIALTCINHPRLRWSTKNLGCIGYRSIFFRQADCEIECACPMSDLRVVGKEKVQ